MVILTDGGEDGDKEDLPDSPEEYEKKKDERSNEL